MRVTDSTKSHQTNLSLSSVEQCSMKVSEQSLGILQQWTPTLLFLFSRRIIVTGSDFYEPNTWHSVWHVLSIREWYLWIEGDKVVNYFKGNKTSRDVESVWCVSASPHTISVGITRCTCHPHSPWTPLSQQNMAKEIFSQSISVSNEMGILP